MSRLSIYNFPSKHLAMNRFDRQLRLWGTHGQQRVEAGRVCVVGSSALSTEILKNLMLPGVRDLTLIGLKSESYIQDQFWDFASWNIVQMDWDANRMKCSKFWECYALVIITTGNAEVRDILRRVRMPPTLLCRVSKFHGFLTFVSSEPHFVIEAHRQHQTADLRLDRPRDQLSSFYCNLPRDPLSFSEWPFAAVLYQARKLALQEKASLKPLNREVLRHHISLMQDELSKNGQSPNLSEAYRFAYLALQNSQHIPENVRECLLLKDKPCTLPYNQNFQNLLRALCKYMSLPHSDGQLPVSGAIPDMESSSKIYNALRRTYMEVAATDASIFGSLILPIAPQFPLDQINLFCKNSRHIRVVSPVKNISTLYDFQGPKSNDTPPVLVFRSLLDMPNDETLDKEHRWKYYPVISAMAGFVAQETTKILTHQFVPIDNTMVYNGMSNEVSVFRI
ncbi:LANO_0B02058g1_1 [Lachancea nothofagi CBS 11611]|uniref:LANO_0B02058g1_1 n=1 Tax=Lachancea nothofagi CBS 11611 TaxID=1266666 RepID=A0A1G4IVZ6_9SACH|nr:LANO_0B02058g1_1 [Lachancea nothofagi CBS 11611]